MIVDELRKAGVKEQWLPSMELLLYHQVHCDCPPNCITAIAEDFTTNLGDAEELRDVLFRVCARMVEGIRNWEGNEQ